MILVCLSESAAAGQEFLGSSRFSAGAIIGIILGVVVIVALALLLGWCYKTGKLPGYTKDTYPNKDSPNKTESENLSRSNTGIAGAEFVSWNQANANKASTTDLSRSNFDLDNPDMWASLTGPVGGKKQDQEKEKSRNLGSGNTGGKGHGSNYYYNEEDYKNRDNRYRKKSDGTNYYENFDRNDPNKLSHSPGSRIRKVDNNANTAGKDRGELGLRGNGRGVRDPESGKDKKSNVDAMKKRTGSGLFENPDSEGYLYDYEQVQALSDENQQKEKKKAPDFESELKNAIKRNSLKRQKSGNQSDPPGAPSSEGELDKINFSDDSVSIPRYDSSHLADSELSSSTPGLGKGDDTGPDAESSPKLRKKKRRDKKSPKSKRKGEQYDDDGENKSPKSKRKADESEPPEVYAPIFSGDETNDPGSVPNMYQPGKIYSALTLKTPPIICSRRQFQILLPFQKITIRHDVS